MKRHSSLIPLSRQHQKALLTAQLIKKNAPEYRDLPTNYEDKKTYTINFYYDHLVPHFKAEEEILIPFLQNRSEKIDKVNDEIVEEHLKIRELVLSIETKNEFVELMDELGFLLESHVRKEERIWFEEIQTVLDEEELENLNGRLNFNMEE